jgi:hypothetical protein
MRLTLDLEEEFSEQYRLLNFCIYIAPQPSQLVVLSGKRTMSVMNGECDKDFFISFFAGNQTLQQVNEKFWKVSTKNVRSFDFVCYVGFKMAGSPKNFQSFSFASLH